LYLETPGVTSNVEAGASGFACKLSMSMQLGPSPCEN
jgi:hypothetical protein